MQLRTAVAPLGAKHIAGKALGVDAHKHRLSVGDVALHEGEVLQPGDAALVHAESEVPVVCRQVHLLYLLHEPVDLATVGD